MERLTNNLALFNKQIKLELNSLNIEKEEQCILHYSEFPSLSVERFSTFVIKNCQTNEIRVVQKTWDAEYDAERSRIGIYNLDRINIKTKEIALPSKKQKEIADLLENISLLPSSLENEGSILLDGVEYELFIHTEFVDKQYHWKTANDEIIHLEPIINFCKTIE